MTVIRLTGIFILLFAILAGISIFFSVLSSRAGATISDAYETRSILTLAQMEIYTASTELMRLTREFVMTDLQDSHVQAQRELAISRINDAANDFAENNVDCAECILLSNVLEYSDKMRDTELRAIEAMRRNAPLLAMDLIFSTEYVRLRESFEYHLYVLANAMVLVNEDMMRDAMDTTARFYFLSNITIMLYAFISITCTLFILSQLISARRKATDAQELTQTILDSAPFNINVWDDDSTMTGASKRSVTLFETADVDEYMREFFNLMPKYQPCGNLSSELAKKHFKNAYETGYTRFEWMHQTMTGKPMPAEVTIVRTVHKGKTILLGYNMDLRQVKQAEEMARKWQDNSPLMMELWDANHNLIDCNKKMIDLFEIPSKAAFNVYAYSPKYQPCGQTSVQKNKNLLNEAMEKGIVHDEWMFTLPNGEELPTIATWVRIDHNGESNIIVYSQDNRPLNAAIAREAELLHRQELNERFKIVLDATPLVIEVWDSNYNIIDCNQTTLDFWGMCDKEEYLRRYESITHSITPEGRPLREEWNSHLATIFKNGAHSFSFSSKGRYGETFYWEVDAIRTQIDFKDVAIVFSKNVTQLQHTQKMLAYREKLLHTLNIATEILLTVSEDNIMAALMSAMELVGCCLDVDRVQIWRNEVVSGELHFVMRYEWLSKLGKEKRKVPLGISFPYSKTNGWYERFTSGENINGPLSALLPDEEAFLGHYEMVSIVILPLFLNDEFIGFFSVDDCLNQRTLTEDEMTMIYSAGLMFTSVFNRVEQARKNSAKSRFLAKMSHEIRTPITAVLGIAEIQLQNPELAPATEEAFAQIFDSGNLLLDIVNEILDLSKIEAGKMELAPIQYQVASLINDVVQPHLAVISSRNFEFQVEVDEKLPANLIGDALRIKQIMNNIMSNAFKYTKAGTVKLSLKCEKTDDSQVVLIISISDTGLGMTPAQIEALSIDYTRFHEQQMSYKAGTGLGMSIVYNLVQMMNADIEVQSKVGVGTKITVCIPQETINLEVLGKTRAKQLESFKMESYSVAKVFKFTPKPMPYGRVLCVDDIRANLYVICELLKFYELKVETCDNGYAAIEKIRSGKTYDLIFLDQMMPDINGVETMHTIRELGYKGPIVAFTANAIMGQADELVRSGFDGFIFKPINTSHLDAILTKHIQDKQPQEVLNSQDTQNSVEERAVSQDNVDKSLKDDNLIEKLKEDFAKTQKNTFDNLVKAIDKNDKQTAIRLAHSLKGLAGLVCEDTLMEAARVVEAGLAGWGAKAEDLAVLEAELSRVLRSIRPREEVVAKARPLDKKMAKDTFDRLTPLLSTRNADGLKFVDELREIPETGELIGQIESFDFEIALRTLRELREKFEIE